MKLYYSPGSCSLASHIVLEECGVSYEAVQVPVADRSNWKPEYLAVNPRGYVPALQGDDFLMTENAAIMLYLAQAHPEAALLPETPKERAKCLEWLSWQTNAAHIAWTQVWRPERFLDDAADYPPLQVAGRGRVRKCLAEIEDWLAGNDFAAGSAYSIADPMFLVFYRWGWRVGEEMDETAYPHYTAYVRRLMERPAVQRTVEQEGISILP